MAKPKYKLGNLIEVPDESTTIFTKVVGIVTTCDGFKYLVGSSDTFCESEVLSAYREIVARKVSTPKKRSKKKDVAQEEQQS